MTSADDKYSVFSTRMNLADFRTKLKKAENGHSLLKKKHDAIKIHFQNLKAALVEETSAIEAQSRHAALAVGRLRYTVGTATNILQENTLGEPVRLSIEETNIGGATLFSFKCVFGSSAARPSFGLAGGRDIFETAQKEYQALLERIVGLASMKTSYALIEKTMQATNRRINSLEHILIPKITKTIIHIDSELDEHDREDFFRIKMIQKNKKIQSNAKDTEDTLAKEEDPEILF
uniref:V-type proton ATPase subunit D1 n=1 Tax=Metchnikovella dogieli TaxID=2804710 RepID=A0A896WPV1_9MICR|nr:V-type proton ATPase subunit D1 [Metchnikovella dogieli]